MYIAPYNQFRQLLTIGTSHGKLTATVALEDLQNLIRTFLRSVEVDEAWYRAKYPDVADAIRQGVFPSAKEHFVADGYFEGRWPFPMEIDEAWYMAQHPEVAEAVKNGIVESAQQHFEENGYREGRLPRLSIENATKSTT
ncbi:MAG: hypothetical protein AB7P69_15840 [Candidatus Binatia bacterium]